MSELAHFAINADDVERGRKFYESVFGWKFSAWGPPGFYQIETGGSSAMRGAIQSRRELSEGRPTIGFECTVSVESIKETEVAVVAAGGKVLLQRSIIAGVGTLAFFQDTEGNVFGAMQYYAEAQ